MDLPTLSVRGGEVEGVAGEGASEAGAGFAIAAFFHHSRTAMWPFALADSRARSVYQSGRPELRHHSRTGTKPAREAPSMASGPYSFLRTAGEVCHHSRMAGLP